MAALRYADTLEFRPIDFPLKHLRIDLDLEVDVGSIPAEARPRLLADALRRVVEDLEAKGDLDRRGGGQTVGRAGSGRRAPSGLHPKAETSLRRFLAAVRDLEADDGRPTLGEVGERAGLSAPVLAKIVNPETPLGRHAAALIRVKKAGRVKHIALTAKGRKSASGIP